jgi:hypothetical protein
MNSQSINLNLLEHAWTAAIRLNNGHVITIWWTAWAMRRMRQDFTEILWVASDLPKQKLN